MKTTKKKLKLWKIPRQFKRGTIAGRSSVWAVMDQNDLLILADAFKKQVVSIELIESYEPQVMLTLSGTRSTLVTLVKKKLGKLERKYQLAGTMQVSRGVYKFYFRGASTADCQFD